MTFGWRTRASSRPSSTTSEAESDAVSLSSLRATSRARRGSWALYTVPNDPSPTRSWIVSGPHACGWEAESCWRCTDATAAITRSWATSPGAGRSVEDSRPSQSTARPSLIASAAPAASRRSGIALHRFGELDERARDGDPRRTRGRLLERRREVVVAVTELDAPDDRLAVLRAHARQSGLVPLHGFFANRLLERRRIVGRHVGHRPGIGRRPPAGLPDLVTDSVHRRLAQVRLERAIPRGLERADVPEARQQRVLDDVARVPRVAGPPRQPPAGESLEHREVAGEERIARVAVSRLGPEEELSGGFGFRRGGGGDASGGRAIRDHGFLGFVQPELVLAVTFRIACNQAAIKPPLYGSAPLV